MSCQPCSKPNVCALRRYGDDGRRPPAFGDGHWKQTTRWCWRGNELVLSDRVKLCEHDSRLVSVAKRNTDEPLVEASLVGNMLSKGTSYMGVPMSVAVVSRCWPHGNRSKGGRSATQALKSHSVRFPSPCGEGGRRPDGARATGESLMLRERNSKVVLPSSRLLL